MPNCAYFFRIVLAVLLLKSALVHAEIPAGLEFHYQFKQCDVTTSTPIYKEKTGQECGIANTTTYSDSSCPPTRFLSCAVPSNGVASWVDITNDEGVFPDRRSDGYGSVEACMSDGKAFIVQANAGGKPGVARPTDGLRYELKSVEWSGEDTRDPVFNGRVRARHSCTYHYGLAKARYAVAPNSECGVASRQLCKVQYEYETCRHEAFGIEKYKIINKKDVSCGIETRIDYFDLSNGTQVMSGKNARLPVAATDMTVGLLCEKSTDSLARYYCLKINELALGKIEASVGIDEIKRTLALKSSTLFAEAMLRGDGRSTFDALGALYRYERTIAADKAAAYSEYVRGVYAAVKLLPDDLYFKMAQQLAKQALQNANPIPPPDNANYEFSPLWVLLTRQNLATRRVQFKDLADTKILLLSTDILTNKSVRGQALVVAEFFVRMSAAYLNKRAYDVLQLGVLRSAVRARTMELQKSIKEATENVQRMKFAPAVEKSILEQIAKADTSEQMATILDDLMKTGRAEAVQTLQETEHFVRELMGKDPLFGVNLAQVHLMQGNYNYAVLALRAAAVRYRQVPDSEKTSSNSDSSFLRFKDNFKTEIATSLEKAKKLFDGLNADTTVNIDVLSLPEDQLTLSYRLMETLERFNIGIGDKLSGTRIQLLNDINSNIIAPLQSASGQEL